MDEIAGLASERLGFGKFSKKLLNIIQVKAAFECSKFHSYALYGLVNDRLSSDDVPGYFWTSNEGVVQRDLHTNARRAAGCFAV